MAEIQTISTIVQIFLNPVVGILLDTIGRKVIICLAWIFMGALAIQTPYWPNIFPWFSIGAIFDQVGMTIIQDSPLVADYITKGSLGKFTVVQALNGTISALFVSIGLIDISKATDYGFVYLIMGCIAMAQGVMLFFFLKDVVRERIRKES